MHLLYQLRAEFKNVRWKTHPDNAFCLGLTFFLSVHLETIFLIQLISPPLPPGYTPPPTYKPAQKPL